MCVSLCVWHSWVWCVMRCVAALGVRTEKLQQQKLNVVLHAVCVIIGTIDEIIVV